MIQFNELSTLLVFKMFPNVIVLIFQLHSQIKKKLFIIAIYSTFYFVMPIRTASLHKL